MTQKQSHPSAARNKLPIAEHFLPFLPNSAKVLEIASGTGEHGAYFCQKRPDIIWQYSELEQMKMVSQNAYALENSQLRPAIKIDVSQSGWHNNIGAFDAIYCANLIHISPWQAAQGLVQGAERLLQSGKLVVLYGPFLMGDKSAASNIEFDADLRSRNPDWGVRELQDVVNLFRTHNFGLKNSINMPRDNKLLVFAKS